MSGRNQAYTAPFIICLWRRSNLHHSPFINLQVVGIQRTNEETQMSCNLDWSTPSRIQKNKIKINSLQVRTKGKELSCNSHDIKWSLFRDDKPDSMGRHMRWAIVLLRVSLCQVGYTELSVLRLRWWPASLHSMLSSIFQLFLLVSKHLPCPKLSSLAPRIPHGHIHPRSVPVLRLWACTVSLKTLLGPWDPSANQGELSMSSISCDCGLYVALLT